MARSALALAQEFGDAVQRDFGGGLRSRSRDEAVYGQPVTRMIGGGLWPIIAAGAAVCLAGCAARRPTHASVKQCLEHVAADRRTCLQGCEGEFEDALVGCYGRSACTERCETRQLVCQAGPLHDLTFCGETAENPRSCQAQLRADRRACTGRPDRAACEEDGRHRAVACWQACRRAHGPALERCAAGFRTCLDSCVAR
jgi:hypothetical protein